MAQIVEKVVAVAEVRVGKRERVEAGADNESIDDRAICGNRSECGGAGRRIGAKVVEQPLSVADVFRRVQERVEVASHSESIGHRP